MDNQNIQQEDFSSLENVKKIDEAVLNTPAEEPKKIQTPPEDNAVKTYFDINKPQQFSPQGDVVLNLDGKQVQVKDDQAALDTKSEMLQQVYGTTEPSIGNIENKAGPYIMFVLIIIGLIIFIMLSLKRSEYILNLEKEIKKIKDNRFGGY